MIESDPILTYCKSCGGALAAGGVMRGRCLACTVTVTFQEDAEPFQPGDRSFGAYELAEEIGRGGMGVVYRATQARLKRTVAVKLLLGGAFAGPEVTRRFSQEAELAGSLHHPGIVPVFEAGELDRQAYYAMEYVAGSSLAELTRGKPLPPLQAARYLQSVAKAVHYAHGQGVLHRDLKPSNILIDAFDDPRITDFGLARSLEEGADLTRTTDAMGSPPYMAPEQAKGKASAVGIPADIYSLGAVLYHLLTGRPPFQGSSAAQILAQVEREAPVRPRRLHPAVPMDLETICLKCLEKQPHQRYPNAAALADDLEKFLQGKAVWARPLGLATRQWRWAKRNPAVAASSSLAVLSLLGGTMAVIHQAVENRVQQDQNLRLDASLRTGLYATDVFAAWQSVQSGDFSAARSWLEPHRQDTARGLEWAWLWRASEPHFSREIGRHQGYVEQVACSPDGQWLVSTGFDDRTCVWNLPAMDKPPLQSFPFYASTPQFLQTGQGMELGLIGQNQIRRYQLPSWNPLPDQPPAAGQISWSLDGKWAAAGDSRPIFFSRQEGAITVYRTAPWTPVWSVPAPAVVVALSPDGQRLATGLLNGSVRVWDVASQSAVSEFAAPEVTSLQFSPDSTLLAAGGNAMAWVQRAGAPVLELPHPAKHMVTDVAFSPDGSQLATACTDLGIRLWHPTAGTLQRSLRGHAREVWSVCYRPGTAELISGGKDGRILAWDTQRKTPVVRRIIANCFQPPILSPDGTTLLAGVETNQEQTTRLIHCQDGRVIREFPEGRLPLAFGRDGAAILRNEDSEIEWWSREGVLLRRVPVPRADRQLLQTAVAPDEGTAAVLTDEGVLHLIGLTDPAPLPRSVALPNPTAPPLHPRCLRWSPDSQWLALGTENRPYSAWLVQAATGHLTELPGQLDLVSGLSFSPDSQILATGTSEGSILVWDVPTGKLRHRLPGHTRSVSDVCFTPDGRTLLSLSYESDIKCWHTGLWRELASFPLTSQAFNLAVSRDQKWLAVTTGSEGKPENIALWPLD